MHNYMFRCVLTNKKYDTQNRLSINVMKIYTENSFDKNDHVEICWLLDPKY